jgi:hypothetical protein
MGRHGDGMFENLTRLERSVQSNPNHGWDRVLPVSSPAD